MDVLWNINKIYTYVYIVYRSCVVYIVCIYASRFVWFSFVWFLIGVFPVQYVIFISSRERAPPLLHGWEPRRWRWFSFLCVDFWRTRSRRRSTMLIFIVTIDHHGCCVVFVCAVIVVAVIVRTIIFWKEGMGWKCTSQRRRGRWCGRCGRVFRVVVTVVVRCCSHGGGRSIRMMRV